MNISNLPIDQPQDPQYAPNWDQGQGLTWSAKWHVIGPWPTERGQGRALCGVYVYTRDSVPRYYAKLQAISTGVRQAPVCKKCQRAQVDR